jgi:hypothetical protein
MTRVEPDRSPALRTYTTLLVSGALAAFAAGAAMIARGDWQAAFVAFAGLALGAFLLSLTRLLAIGEGPARTTPSAPRPRAPTRPLPAAEPRREGAPPAVAPPRARLIG